MTMIPGMPSFRRWALTAAASWLRIPCGPAGRGEAAAGGAAVSGTQAVTATAAAASAPGRRKVGAVTLGPADLMSSL